MIHVEFEPPDRKCSFTDAGGKAREWLLRAEQETEMRKRLERAGCNDVEFEPYDFRAWLAEAESETRKLVEDHDAGRPMKFDSTIWRALRRYITLLFHDKCAYCEVSVEAGAPTQVEHYRPKSVYYWLAYHPDNYVPACAWCNSRKGNKFPLAADGVRATGPRDDLALEKPLLVNPAVAEPREHIEFGVLRDDAAPLLPGAIHARSIEGETTITTLDLNRPDLFERRRTKQEKLRTEVGKAFMSGPAAVRGLRHLLESGRDEMSAAQLAQMVADLEAAL